MRCCAVCTSRASLKPSPATAAGKRQSGMSVGSMANQINCTPGTSLQPSPASCRKGGNRNGSREVWQALQELPCTRPTRPTCKQNSHWRCRHELQPTTSCKHVAAEPLAAAAVHACMHADTCMHAARKLQTPPPAMLTPVTSWIPAARAQQLTALKSHQRTSSSTTCSCSCASSRTTH